MKSRLMVCMMLLVLFAAPAFADTISFTNSGLVSGSLSSGIVSTMDSLTFNGGAVTGGNGLVMFDLGQFTGSLEHGGALPAVISGSRWEPTPALRCLSATSAER